MHQEIIRLPAVMRMTGISRSTIYRLVKNKDFPPRIRITERSIGFLSSEVEGWLKDRIAQRSHTIINRAHR